MKRIPVPIGIVCILILIGIIGISLELATRKERRSIQSLKPQTVMAVNISDTSFTLIWKTTEPTTGVASLLGPDGVVQTKHDVRDANGVLPHRAHFITFSSLLPKSKYDVTVLSGGEKFTVDTGPIITAPRIGDNTLSLQPAFGTVHLADSTSHVDDILLLTPDGGQTLAALIQPSGSWVIPFSSARTESLQAWYSATVPKPVTLKTLITQGTTVSTTTDAVSPVEPFALGQTIDMTVAQQKIAQSKSTVLGVSDEKDTSKDSNELMIFQPKNNASIALPRPIIRGKTAANSTVTITLSGVKPESSSVQSDAQGIFLYTPKKDLSNGQHTVTATTRGASDKPIALSHVFSISNRGPQVLGDETEITPTEEPAIPEETPQEYYTESTDTPQEMPVTGSVSPWIGIAFVGLVLFFFGSVTRIL